MNKFGLIVVALSFVAFLQDSSYITDILAVFRFQYLWFFLALALINLFLKKIHFFALYAVVSLINFVLIYPSWMTPGPIKSPDLKIYFANILASNKKNHLVLESIARQGPDIVVLQEVNENWRQKLIALKSDYKYHIMLSRQGNFGMAIYSKLKILRQEILKGKAQVESILFVVRANNKDVPILTTHPVAPIGRHLWRLRNGQYIELQQYLNEIEGEKILIGDLNNVPWSKQLKQLSKSTNLKQVNTFRDTWNSSFPLGMRIKLDHAFISKGLKGALRVLDGIGSDHLPIILDLKYQN